MSYVEPWTANSLAEACQHCHRIVMGFLASEDTETKWRPSTKSKVHEAMAVVNRALDIYTLEEMAFSFNGGKDCLVMLIIFLAVLHIRTTTGQGPKVALPDRLSTVYVHSECAFNEVDEFVAHCNDQYFLSPTRLSGELKQAFKKYLHDHPEKKAVVVGIRRTDPYGEHLTAMVRTDHGWPDFMRIHPVLNWHLGEIWDFIKSPTTEFLTEPNEYSELSKVNQVNNTSVDNNALGSVYQPSTTIPRSSQISINSSISSNSSNSSFIAYCSLYDRGYTSLGGTNNTFKNPSLKEVDDSGRVTYKPAYLMEDDDKERIGRS